MFPLYASRNRESRGQSPESCRILIAADPEEASLLQRRLCDADPSFLVDTVSDGRSALNALAEGDYSYLLTDLSMTLQDARELIDRVRAEQWPVTILVMASKDRVDQAIQAIHLGAYDYLTKPVLLDHLRLILDRSARERRLVEEAHQLRAQLEGPYGMQKLLGKNPAMQGLFELMKHLATSTTPVLIEGEAGTGKGEVARAIHQASAPWRPGPLITINCAALPAPFLETDLFGQRNGTVSSDSTQRMARFADAHQGTLFLDDVDTIPLPLQARLLGVLEERRFGPGSGPDGLDVRILAASRYSLAQLVKRGRVRKELYDWLNSVKIELPPLRERLEDVPLLATHFAAHCAYPARPRSLSPAAMEGLLRHDWPGNVRELETTIERACLIARGQEIEPEDLLLEGNQSSLPPPRRSVDLRRSLPELVQQTTEELEKKYLIRALRKTRGNIGRCARLCGLSRRSISAKLRQYDIDKRDYKSREK
jgi:DNA-binding NtrC family response regulator